MILYRCTLITVTDPRPLKSFFLAMTFLIHFWHILILIECIDAPYLGIDAVILFTIHFKFVLCAFMYSLDIRLYQLFSKMEVGYLNQ